MKDRRNRRAAFSARSITRGAALGALYVVLTFVSSLIGLGSGAVQVRLSEALCVLPAFMPEAVLGLYIGCIIANLLCGCVFWDILFGSLATLIGALGAYLIGRCGKGLFPLIPLPTVIANSVIVPLVLVLAYGAEGALPLLILSVGIGEVISAWLLGCVLYYYIDKSRLL